MSNNVFFRNISDFLQNLVRINYKKCKFNIIRKLHNSLDLRKLKPKEGSSDGFVQQTS